MILAIGDLAVDVFLLPELRHAEQGGGIVLRHGGSAANTAAWAAHRGAPAAFIGCAGEDAWGMALIRELEAGGVVQLIRAVRGMETGAVSVTLESDGERSMRSSRGANQALSPEDIDRAALSSLRIVHVTGYALLGPPGLENLRAAARKARDAGALLSFDPGSESTIEHVGARVLLAEISALAVDILLPNAGEARVLTDHGDPEEACAALASFVPLVVVKDGSRGAVYATGPDHGRVETKPTVAVDTTGAGDAFDGGFIAAQLAGSDLEAACSAGHRAALETIVRYGGRPAYESR